MAERDWVPLKERMKADANVYTFGPFRMTPARQLLERAGEPLELTSRAYELLYVFARSPKYSKFSRLVLDNEVFGREMDAARVPQLIKELRDKLGRRDDGEQYVKTVHTQGYMLSVEVSAAPDEGAGPEAGDERDLQTENLHLEGVYWLDKCSQEGFDNAVEIFERLIVSDPRDVRAHLKLSQAYTWATVFNYNRLPAAEALEKAREAAERAGELAPASAAAHAALAFSHMCYARDWDGASKELRAAVGLDAKLAAPHLGLALWYAAQGDDAAAKREIDRAHELEKLSRLMNVTKGFVYFFVGETGRSLEQFKETIRITKEYRVAAFDGAYFGLALLAAMSGSFAEAHEAAGKAYEFAHNVLDKIAEAFILALERREAEARAALEGLSADAEKTYVSPYHMATIAAALGDKDLAFRWLHRARDERDPWIIAVRRDARFEGLHPDPRFDELLTGIGLPPL